jgi:hypothetical protein
MIIFLDLMDQPVSTEETIINKFVNMYLNGNMPHFDAYYNELSKLCSLNENAYHKTKYLPEREKHFAKLNLAARNRICERPECSYHTINIAPALAQHFAIDAAGHCSKHTKICLSWMTVYKTLPPDKVIDGSVDYALFITAYIMHFKKQPPLPLFNRLSILDHVDALLFELWMDTFHEFIPKCNLHLFSSTYIIDYVRLSKNLLPNWFIDSVSLDAIKVTVHHNIQLDLKMEICNLYIEVFREIPMILFDKLDEDNRGQLIKRWILVTKTPPPFDITAMTFDSHTSKIICKIWNKTFYRPVPPNIYEQLDDEFIASEENKRAKRLLKSKK